MRRAAAVAVALLPQVAAAAPAEYLLEPTHSFVHFEIRHAGLSTLHGRFNRSSGRITLDREGQRGSAAVSVPLASLDTGRAEIDRALRTALGAAAADSAAEAHVEIEAMQFDGERVRGASGTLALHGQRVPLALQADQFNCYRNPLLRQQVCGGEFSAVVDLAGLGVRLDPALGLAATVQLRVQVEAVRQP